MEIADRGIKDACAADPALARGVNTVAGRLTYGPVGAAHGLPSVDLSDVL